MGKSTPSLARKFNIAFVIMFIIPSLVGIYLVLYLALDLHGEVIQIFFLIFFCLLLGVAGYLIQRSILRTLLSTARNVKAVAEGDLSTRVDIDADSEISGLARNFNRITDTLQENIDNLEKSKKQIHSLLTHITQAVESPLEINRLLDVYVSSILSLLEFRIGFIAVMTEEKSFNIISKEGFTDDEFESFQGDAVKLLHRVVKNQKPLIMLRVSEHSRENKDFGRFYSTFGDTISVPLIKSRNIIGAITVASGMPRIDRDSERGDTKTRPIDADDIQMLQNLAAQISIAIENARLRKSMEKTYFESIASLAAAVEARDRYTKGHSTRVSEFATATAREMGLPETIVNQVRDAALLHDIGKIGMPDAILNSPSPILSDDMKALIRAHPEKGENIIKPLKSLTVLCPIVRHHHEKYDGTGYPDGLKEKEIPIESRIMGVADAFDAMTSERSYRKNLSKEEATREIRDNSGTQFDPECVDAFTQCLEKHPKLVSLMVRSDYVSSRAIIARDQYDHL